LADRHAAWKEGTVTAGQLVNLQSLDGKLLPGQDWRMKVKGT
jgi:hypothetical protein